MRLLRLLPSSALAALLCACAGSAAEPPRPVLSGLEVARGPAAPLEDPGEPVPPVAGTPPAEGPRMYLFEERDAFRADLDARIAAADARIGELARRGGQDERRARWLEEKRARLAERLDALPAVPPGDWPAYERELQNRVDELELLLEAELARPTRA